MKKNQKTQKIQFKRKVEGRTNYRKRLKLIASYKPRLVVRKTSRNIIAQIIEFNPKGDHVISSAYSKELQKLGWKFSRNNLPAAYLTGLLCGAKAMKKNIKEAILDIGLNTPINRSIIYAVLKGALDSNLKIPYSKEVLPDEKRISGEHIVAYSSLLKNNEIYKKQFSQYLKQGVKPEDITKYIKEIKEKILKK